MSTRVFVIYAAEDHHFCDRLIEQARSSKLAVEFDRMQNKQPWVPMWKGQCRTKVFGCDAAIVLISKKTQQGVGIAWELECAREAHLPMLGLHVDKFDKGTVPPELKTAPLIDWNWPEIAGFVQSLTRGSSTSA